MALTKMRFKAYLNPQDDGDPREVVAEILNVDRLTAERQLVPMGANELPMTMTTAWIWASLVRTKQYTGPCERFMHVDCLDFDPLEEGEEVPPTEPAATTGSPSSSP